MTLPWVEFRNFISHTSQSLTHDVFHLLNTVWDAALAPIRELNSSWRRRLDNVQGPVGWTNPVGWTGTRRQRSIHYFLNGQKPWLSPLGVEELD